MLGGSSSIYVIDARTHAVIKSIVLGTNLLVSLIQF